MRTLPPTEVDREARYVRLTHAVRNPSVEFLGVLRSDRAHLLPTSGAILQRNVSVFESTKDPTNRSGFVFDNLPYDWRRMVYDNSMAATGVDDGLGVTVELDYGAESPIGHVTVRAGAPHPGPAGRPPGAAHCPQRLVGAEVTLEDAARRSVWTAVVEGVNADRYAVLRPITLPLPPGPATQEGTVDVTLVAHVLYARFIRVTTPRAVAVHYLAALRPNGARIPPVGGTLTQSNGWVAGSNTKSPANVSGTVVDGPADWRNAVLDNTAGAVVAPHPFSPSTLELDLGSDTEVHTVIVKSRSDDPTNRGWIGARIQVLSGTRATIATYTVSTLSSTGTYELRLSLTPVEWTPLNLPVRYLRLSHDARSIGVEFVGARAAVGGPLLVPTWGALMQQSTVVYSPSLNPADASGMVYDESPQDWRRLLLDNDRVTNIATGTALLLDYGEERAVQGVLLRSGVPGADLVGAEMQALNEVFRMVWRARVRAVDADRYAAWTVVPLPAAPSVEMQPGPRTVPLLPGPTGASPVRFLQVRTTAPVGLQYVAALNASGARFAPTAGSLSQDNGWSYAPRMEPTNVSGAVVDASRRDWRHVVLDGGNEAIAPGRDVPMLLELDYGQPQPIHSVIVKTGTLVPEGWLGSTVKLLDANRSPVWGRITAALSSVGTYIHIVPQPPVMSSAPADPPSTPFTLAQVDARFLRISGPKSFGLEYLAARNEQHVRYQPKSGVSNSGGEQYVIRTDPTNVNVFDDNSSDWRRAVLSNGYSVGGLYMSHPFTVTLDYGQSIYVHNVVVRTDWDQNVQDCDSVLKTDKVKTLEMFQGAYFQRPKRDSHYWKLWLDPYVQNFGVTLRKQEVPLRRHSTLCKANFHSKNTK